MERAPRARDWAAAAVGISGRAMAEAKRVGEHAPDLVPAVRAGSPCALSACYTNARLSSTCAWRPRRHWSGGVMCKASPWTTNALMRRQVERGSSFGRGLSGERVSNTWATCPQLWDNPGKPGLIPDMTSQDTRARRATPVEFLRDPLPRLGRDQLGIDFCSCCLDDVGDVLHAAPSSWRRAPFQIEPAANQRLYLIQVVGDERSLTRRPARLYGVSAAGTSVGVSEDQRLRADLDACSLVAP